MSLAIERVFTSRLLLRRVRRDDIAMLVKWSQSVEYCGKYLSPECFDHVQLQHQLESHVFWSDEEKLFIIETKEEHTPIGTIHFWQPTGKTDTRVVALKIAEPNQRSKGYGTESQKFLIIYLFERLGIQRIEMYTDINNTAQQRCLQKLGFDLVESLSYEDQKEYRTGNLYCLDYDKYLKEPIYKYHYE